MSTYLKRSSLLLEGLVLLLAIPLWLGLIAILVNHFYNSTIYRNIVVCLGMVSIAGFIWICAKFCRQVSGRIAQIIRLTNDLSIGKTGSITIDKNDELSKIESALNAINKRNHTTATFTRHLITDEQILLDELSGFEDTLTSNLFELKKTLSAHKEDELRRQWASESQVKFVEILRTNENVKSLANEVIKNLVQILKANQGALFIAEENESGPAKLEMTACYAFNRMKHQSMSVMAGEGIIGQTYLEKETTYIKQVPENFIQIRSGLGDANPKAVLIVPFLFEEKVVAIAELAAFQEFKKHEIEFVEKVGESIAHAIASIQTSQKTQALLQASLDQAEELQSQEEELRQNQEELQATQEEISRKYDELFRKLKDLNYDSKFEQLKAINSSKKRSIEYYFDIIRNQIITFSENIMVLDAVKEFKTAYYQMAVGTSKGDIELWRKSVAEYYENEFITKLNDNADEIATSESYTPSDLRTLLFQHLFIAANPHPTGQKCLLNNPGDSSDYSKVHSVYHPILKNFLEKFGYYDIFLIDSNTGEMLYSVFKEVDFATNLLNGIYSTTNFGQVVKEAIESTDKNFVKLIDFEPYDPSYKAPASFIACPVYDGETKIGILVFQMPINKINQILTGDNSWKEDGLGKTGETIIVGSDSKLRSISRKLIEHKEEYYQGLQRMGYNSNTLQQIQKSNTSILLETMNINSVNKALKGETGIGMDTNNMGIKTLNAFAPLHIEDVQWILLSSIEEEEASEVINDLKKL